jgi:DNA invertase Pin-like site-specific DNA recombinase
MRGNEKVQGQHLARSAYLYVRQAVFGQTFQNTDSTQRQYALKQSAVALGWSPDDIVVIDSDIGKSGASARGRKGFRRLIKEVSLGRAGIVMAFDLSRFARNLTELNWLLTICAMTKTLILTDDGIYDPADFKDMLLLGLKETMSQGCVRARRVTRHSQRRLARGRPCAAGDGR